MLPGIRVTLWNEGIHEKEMPKCKAISPDGIHRVIGAYLEGKPGIAKVNYAELGDPEQGLSEETLANTDVMTWWGHAAHDRVTDERAARVQQRVLEGMGLIVLHSGHMSKPFMRLMGTGCQLKWREYGEDGERERLWVVDPTHPIVEGLPECIELPNVEMYGEPFGIPKPDELVFISWFQGGEVFRSGCCWRRERGKVFYFRPGHETFPIYHNESVAKVIYNAVRWAAPNMMGMPAYVQGNVQPLEKMESKAEV